MGFLAPGQEPHQGEGGIQVGCWFVAGFSGTSFTRSAAVADERSGWVARKECPHAALFVSSTEPLRRCTAPAALWARSLALGVGPQPLRIPGEDEGAARPAPPPRSSVAAHHPAPPASGPPGRMATPRAGCPRVRTRPDSARVTERSRTTAAPPKTTVPVAVLHRFFTSRGPRAPGMPPLSWLTCLLPQPPCLLLWMAPLLLPF